MLNTNLQLSNALKVALRWIAGVLFVQLAFGALFTFPPAAIGYFLAAAFCIPPVLNALETRLLKLKLQRWLKYATVLAGAILSTWQMDQGLTAQGVFDEQRIQAAAKRVTVYDTVKVYDTTRVEIPVQVPAASAPIYSSSAPKPSRTRRARASASSSGSMYQRGPRGGCYYINASGRKVYVDRSLCD
jgi:hypothetical protein